MLKKYFKEILICFAFIVGFGCGWFGCKSYIQYQLNQAIEQFDKDMSEYCDSITNSTVNDTTATDTITGCEF